MPNPKVDAFLTRSTQWHDEFVKLRSIFLETTLTEELKWGHPCYAFEGRNVALMHGFKDYCAILFIKGALLADPHHILVQQTENVQSARQLRFKNVAEIEAIDSKIREYLNEAIENEKAGRDVTFKTPKEFATPVELIEKFEEDPELKIAFEALTPGRQKAYLLYFANAKHAQTRRDRIERYVTQIKDNKGMDD